LRSTDHSSVVKVYGIADLLTDRGFDMSEKCSMALFSDGAWQKANWLIDFDPTERCCTLGDLEIAEISINPGECLIKMAAIKNLAMQRDHASLSCIATKCMRRTKFERGKSKMK
jgi:hypothetical protein